MVPVLHAVLSRTNKGSDVWNLRLRKVATINSSVRATRIVQRLTAKDSAVNGQDSSKNLGRVCKLIASIRYMSQSICPSCKGELKKFSVIYEQQRFTGEIEYTEQDHLLKKSPDVWEQKPIKVLTIERIGKGKIEFLSDAAKAAAPPLSNKDPEVRKKWEHRWKCQNCGVEVLIDWVGKHQQGKPYSAP